MNSDILQASSGESNTDPLEKETSCSENKDKEKLTMFLEKFRNLGNLYY
jgi:hypothetical protein